MLASIAMSSPGAPGDLEKTIARLMMADRKLAGRVELLPDEELTKYVKAISDQYKQLNFVQRYMDPAVWPVIDKDPRLEPGWVATHQMSWSGPDRAGQYMVYPNIVYDKKTKKLKWLEGAEAVKYARDTGEFIPFSTPQAADMFSREYKRASRKE